MLNEAVIREQQEEIDQLKAQVISLEKNRSYYQDAERELSNAYLRLRVILGALDTQGAPTAQQVWKHTEDKANGLKAQVEGFKIAIAEHDINLIDKLSEEADRAGEYYVTRWLRRMIKPLKQKLEG